MKKGLLIIALMAFANFSKAQDGVSYWKTTVKKSNAVTFENKKQITNPKLFQLDFEMLKNVLIEAPKKGGKIASNVIVSFPDVDGSVSQFKVVENSNMDPALEAKYPGIHSYVGQGINDPTALIYFSVSPLGLQTMLVRADKSAVFIEPYTTDQSAYVVYRKSDKAASLNTFECSVVSKVMDGTNLTARPNADDGFLRNYRLALSVTGEYTVFFGGTKPLALAAMNNSMTRVNGVFEIDFGVHMTLIANNDLVIYTNASTDPYSVASTGSGGAWNQELQTTLTNVIGSANYDIGHLFGASGGGGNAGCIGCVCVNPTAGTPLGKGSGFTSPADAIPSGDNFDIDYVAHEMGHQFGGNHTFTHSNEGTGAQMEPGSGSTIMGYAGITGATDVQPHSDAFFHAISIQQITNYIKTTTCQTNTPSGNAIPTANAGLDYTTPKGTPFKLTGAGTDANGGDVLSYCWEQMDVGTPTTTFPSVTATTGSAFKSFLPSTTPFRYFPQLSTVKTGATSWTWEAVPNVARALNFRLTVRDNHAGGPANNSDDMIVTVNATAGPFIVTVPNTTVVWPAGSTQTVTWNVAGTTANGVNTANVDILLSTDGGNTYPITLLAATPNDGTQSITVPNNIGITNRIMVKGTNHIFFDISDVNFRISDPNGGLSFISTSPFASSAFCPGEVVNVVFTTDGAAQAGNIFTAQLSNSAGSFASPVNIGTLTSVNQGTIIATIPPGTAGGTGYRIRVSSSNPVIIGSDNGSNLNIISVPTTPNVSPGGPTAFCTGGSVLLSYTQSPGAAYQWRKDGVPIAGQTAASYSANATGSYDVIGGLSQTFLNSTAASIPDNSCTGAASTIGISGYTGSVTSSAITIKINITHTWDGDLALMLQAPNGSILGLSNLTGSSTNSGDNFTNTIFSDAGTIAIPTTGAPYTGTYKPVATTFTSCITTTITTFAAIGGGAINPNGNWILRAYDRAAADVGTIVNWSITFPASVNDQCLSVSNAIAVSVNPPSASSVSIAANPGTTICQGTNVTFTASPTNGGVSPSYQWKKNGSNVGLNSPTYSNSTLVNTDVISCVMTAGAGCFTGSPAPSNSLSITVNSVDDGNACTTDACNTQTGVATHTSVPVDDGNPCTADACNSATGTITHTNICGGVILNLNVMLEGFYVGGGMMNPLLYNYDQTQPSPNPSITSDMTDSVKVSVMDDIAFSHQLVDSKVGILKSNGDLIVSFNAPVVPNSNYYIKLNHRNHVETWSATAVQLTPITNYSFMSSQSQAFGMNQALTFDALHAALFAGDLNQDGSVDGTDYIILDPFIQNGNAGYVIGDLNGDGAVDGSDYLVLDPNSQNGVGVAVPTP